MSRGEYATTFLDKSGVSAIEPTWWISMLLSLSSPCVICKLGNIIGKMSNMTEMSDTDSVTRLLLNMTLSKLGNPRCVCLYNACV